MGQGAARRFEFNDGKTSKFWEIEVTGTQFTVRYGKIGTAGQTQTKDYADAAAAAKSAEKLIAEKTGKGYQEVGGSAPPQTTTAAAAPATPTIKKTAVAKTKAAKPADLAKDPEVDPGALEALAGTGEAIDRALAKNPKSSAALLEKLSHSSDKTTRNYVVLHPNSPKEVLVKLAHQFPADFFKNPAFDWMLIEDPDLMQRIGGNVLGSLLKRPDCPQSFLNWAVKHGTEKERLAVAMNSEASIEALQQLVVCGGAVAEAAKNHQRMWSPAAESDPIHVLEDEVRKAFGDLYWRVDETWRRSLIGPAQWKALSPKAKLEVTSISNPLQQFTTPESDPNSPVDLLEQLASDPDLKVRQDVAKNPRTSLKALTILAADKSERVRVAVAEHSLCGPALLDQLAADPYWGLRAVVAMHPLCSKTLLLKLADDPEPAVRAAVAGNQACPQDLFPELVTDKSDSVRRAVAANPACPAPFLEVLVKQKGFGIAQALVNNRACPPEILKQFGVRVSQAGPGADVYALRYQPRPVDELRNLADSKNADIRLSVALNPACPPELLESLARDTNEAIAFEIARKPSCPPALSAAILENLSRSKDKDVLRAVARLISTPEELRFAAFSALLKKLGPQGIKELDDEPLCPPSIREVVRARIWRQQIKSLAKKYGTQAIFNEAVGNLDDEQLVAAARQEFASLNCEADQGDSSDALGLLSRILATDQAGSILAIPVESADNAARHSELAIRLLGLHHAHTSPEILARRSKSTEWQERLAIASNPSCPPNVREKLKNDPHRLVAAAARLGTERNQSTAARQTLTMAQTDTLDTGVLVAEVRRRLSAKSDLHQFEKIGAFSRSAWQTSIEGWRLFNPYVAEHSACPEPIRQLMLEAMAGDKDDRDRLAAAGNAACPLSLLEVLAKDKDSFVRRGVAGNVACPLSLLEVLAKDRTDYVRDEVAENPSYPEPLRQTLLKAMAKSEDGLSRRRVAGNASCPVSLLKVLAKDKEYSVRCEVAKNAACPEPLRLSLLTVLSKDKNKHIRREVAANPACPALLLEVLAKDGDEDVRLEVAKNPACPDPIRQSLLEMLANSRSFLAILEVAGNPASALSLLEALTKEESYVRRAVAENVTCPVSLLEVLAKDDDESVRCAAAENAACPEALRQSLFEAMAKSDDPEIEGRIAEHPAASPRVLDVLVESGVPWSVCLVINHENTTQEQLLRWANDVRLHSTLRLACMTSPQFPVSAKALVDEIKILAEAAPPTLVNLSDAEWILAFEALGLYPDPDDKKAVAKNAKSKDWMKRAAATFCSSIQPNQLKLLLDDSEQVIRQLAADRLRQRESIKS